MTTRVEPNHDTLVVQDDEDDDDDVLPLEASPASLSNESVLNFAFLSFLAFTTLQFFFALIAHSQSMMTDCAAMYVDVVTYLFNTVAEHLKHGHSGMSSRDLRLRRLYLELVPPSISVVTLVIVTILSLRDAIATLDTTTASSSIPDLEIMLLFSALNLVLDILNVNCFAKVDMAFGVQSHYGYHPEVHHHHHAAVTTTTNNKGGEGSILTESTPLVSTAASDDDASDWSSEASGALNLNMCSAWTHIAADTLRSIAVLIAAGFAYLFPQYLTPSAADSWGAIVVSIIILVSLGPLLKGLYETALKIKAMWSSCCASSTHFEVVV